MSTREDKLLAARKRLREFQSKSRADSDTSNARKDSINTISPTPSNDARTESPAESARMAYERRQTVEMGQLPLSNDVVIDYDDNTQAKIIPNLQLQLMRQNQALSVLVAERNDAENMLSRVQSELQQKSDYLEDIKGKYSESIRRIYELENASPRPMTSVMVSQVEEEMRGAQEIAAQKLAQMDERLHELQARLSAKISDNENLNERVSSLSNALSLAEVKIQQLTSDEAPQSHEREKELLERNAELEKHLSLSQRRLQAAAMEGEQASHRFQMYADQCNSQQNALKNQIREVNEALNTVKSENVLLRGKIGDLEKRIEESKNQENPLEARIDSLNREMVQLVQQLREKDDIITKNRTELDEKENVIQTLTSEVQTTLERLRTSESSRLGTENPDAALLAAIESDKVAASRAVAQNQVLKQQILELQEAFKRLNDEKLVLTEKYSKAEEENSELKMQLSASNHDHCDDHDHEDHDHHSEDDDLDMETLRKVVAALRADKAELVKRLQKNSHHGHHHTDDHNHSDHHDPHHGHDHGEEHHHGSVKEDPSQIHELQRAVEQLQEDKAHLLKRLGCPVEDPEVQGLLEVKLRRTMDEIASLDEEKQRLEHLVLQLQGETETIGEYIALYHKQRLLLKQRAVEKDEQLVQMAKDKEELREKLASLNQLISKLVAEKPNVSETVGPVEETASAIQTLITEIENNNVVHCQTINSFEQCSCCSGRLITLIEQAPLKIFCRKMISDSSGTQISNNLNIEFLKNMQRL